MFTTARIAGGWSCIRRLLAVVGSNDHFREHKLDIVSGQIAGMQSWTIFPYLSDQIVHTCAVVLYLTISG